MVRNSIFLCCVNYSELSKNCNNIKREFKIYINNYCAQLTLKQWIAKTTAKKEREMIWNLIK